jgi:GT2 family glycosyltransferase
MVEKGASPSVTAVVLTWNDTEMAGRCVESVLGNDYENLRVLLVDNGSAEPCGETVRERFPEIDLVVLPRNRGFTGGCNAGLSKAISDGAEYVFLLNNDTVVEARAIGRVVRYLEEHPNTAAASALIIFPGEPQFYYGSVDRNIARHTRPDDETPMEGRDWPDRETEFLPACAEMFRAKAVREVGLFDESLGTCWEDYDLCLRLTGAGWRLATVGDAHVEHWHGATTGRASPYITYYFTRNRLICLFRYGRPSGILRSLPRLVRTFWWQINGYGLGDWPCHAAFLKGILHFILGVRGLGAPPKQRKG